MVDFFKNLNFPRSVILLSAIASIVLGWFVYKGNERLSEIASEEREAPKLVKQIHQLGFSVDGLSALRSNEGLIGVLDDVELYVRQKAKEPAIAIGDIQVSPSTRPASIPGVEDVIYTLRPSDREADFSRHALGNFLYKLDTDSNRLVVTKVELTPSQRLRASEIGNDRWQYVIEITARQRMDR